MSTQQPKNVKLIPNPPIMLIPFFAVGDIYWNSLIIKIFCLNCFQKQSFLPNKLGLIRTTAVFQLFKLCADVCRQEVEQEDVSTATDVVSEHTNSVGGGVSRDQSEFKQQEVNTEHLSDT